MNKLELICIGGAISYSLRVFPMLALRWVVFSENSKLSRFLNYAAYSVMGGIIYSATYGERFFYNIEGHFIESEILKFLAVGSAFIIGLYTRSIIKTLLICLLGYTAFGSLIL